MSIFSSSLNRLGGAISIPRWMIFISTAKARIAAKRAFPTFFVTWIPTFFTCSLPWFCCRSQGWTNTTTYIANTGVRSCSSEHERTRTRIFQKLLNTNEHELGKVINYRTRTNTNTKLKVDEQRTRDRTWNTWSNTEHVIEYWIYDKYQM